MKSDSIKKFLQIRLALQKEQAELAARLQALDEALGLAGPATSMPVAPSKPLTRRPAGGGGGLSLREAVVRVTSTQPLTKAEILKAIRKIGYRFQTKEPLKSLNPLLYGDNPKFARTDGKFSSAPAPAPTAGKPKAAPAPKGKKTMDAAARAKLSAIAKARWAKARKAGKSKL